MKKEKFRGLLFLLAGGILLLFIWLINSYFEVIMRREGLTDTELEKIYQYHYIMIVDNRNTSFWQAVYENASEEAKAQDAVVELRGIGWTQDYDKADFMDMSIAAQVDGIILEYNGEAGLDNKINEAEEKGIPVVTIVNDAPKTRRQSFVGITDYQLGQAYGAQVAALVNEDTTRVLVLLNRDKSQEITQNQLYSQINSAIVEKSGAGRVKVQAQNLMSKSQFDAEEAIRNIFQSHEGPPEILVCLDEITTECACQAMIDFNMVGEVQVVGYYTTRTIIDALAKGLIPMTFTMDTVQIGKYSVEALTEYHYEGRVNSYYNVDLNFITGGDVRMDEEKSSEKK